MAAFEGLVSPSEQMKDRFEMLESSRGLQVLQTHIRSLIAQYRQQNARFNTTLDKLLEQDHPSSDELINTLQISKLQQMVQDTTNKYTAKIARNLLELIYVKASFYTPRTLLIERLPERVPVALQVALAIKPPNLRTHLFYLRAYNAMKEFDAAWDHVRQLFEMGIPPEYLKKVPQLQLITGAPTFQKLAREYDLLKRAQ